MSSLAKTITDVFPQRTVVIIGDLVADQFLNGTISRVSREAPVFILRHDETTTFPGAAANAAANVASLGGRSILIGVAGTDASGDRLMEGLAGLGVSTAGVIRVPELSTTTKIRVLAGQHYAARQQVIRIDYENTGVIGADLHEALRLTLAAAVAEADAVIISDYGYGAVFPQIVDDAKALAVERGIALIVDSRHRLEMFAGATTATPNREEVEAILGEDFTAEDCSALRARLGFASLVVTNGNEGMTIFQADRDPVYLDVVGPKEPVDVTGAGDTVIAAYALGLASGLSFADAAALANHAGGIVVMKKGTATVTPAELAASVGDRTVPAVGSKAE